MKTKRLTFFLLFSILCSIFAFSPHNNNTNKPFVIVLDAGHGGHDTGNTGNGYREKDIALNIVLEVGKILEQDPNVKVIYTRKDDRFIELFERGAIANRADADLFVSVHCNAHKSAAYGTETFVLGLHANERNLEVAKKENEVIFLEDNYEENYAGYDPNNPASFIGLTLMQEEYLNQSIMLAGLVQNNFTNRLNRKDRSVKQAGFIVLHQSYMPSVLIETGFLTNKTEGAYLNSKKGQKEMAVAIADAIKTYRQNLSLATSETQNPVITQEEIDEAIETTEEKVYEGVIFKVQLAASSKKLETKPYNFKGLKEITRDKEDSLYKYYYGETSNYNKIQLMKTYAREKGYPSCFIVAFRAGQKVKLSEVLKDEDQ
ncbi:MAG TPA: N-acetylmuramoyl-L-alanine amidase [Flavobacteriaceae bacterium]|nr:N-acetylmuramoyl-L-alanine amidase [Flavobacteriaceae bacterium]HPF10187.1 N-acetylmuramoyl-L-alanine amidase [Flavobacteriaceae bacterium]HQU21671.1 N-acetylmuramoyl-L-alanine amidase [Flavobacteriaceae bacterium]HQU66294.1 N-acetylmuramoyl-L-alanine amidase [Flavobacteriaceae bacterium]HRW43855.1 N-acetylmuramoyl-L-alanine amidase [Flavobacteriaceae bacterium]